MRHASLVVIEYLAHNLATHFDLSEKGLISFDMLIVRRQKNKDCLFFESEKNLHSF